MVGQGWNKVGNLAVGIVIILSTLRIIPVWAVGITACSVSSTGRGGRRLPYGRWLKNRFGGTADTTTARRGMDNNVAHIVLPGGTTTVVGFGGATGNSDLSTLPGGWWRLLEPHGWYSGTMGIVVLLLSSSVAGIIPTTIMTTTTVQLFLITIVAWTIHMVEQQR